MMLEVVGIRTCSLRQVTDDDHHHPKSLSTSSSSSSPPSCFILLSSSSSSVSKSFMHGPLKEIILSLYLLTAFVAVVVVVVVVVDCLPLRSFGWPKMLMTGWLVGWELTYLPTYLHRDHVKCEHAAAAAITFFCSAELLLRLSLSRSFSRSLCIHGGIIVIESASSSG